MRFVPRLLGKQLQRAARQSPALIVTGPRRAGKTTLLRRLFPAADYRLLEDPDVVARIRSDPRAFMEELCPPVILDEVQNTPEILAYVRTRIDSAPRRAGQWILTGSQDAPLMQGVTESLAGRAAVFRLLPLSTEETEKVSILRGGFPEVLARPTAGPVWFRLVSIVNPLGTAGTTHPRPCPCRARARAAQIAAPHPSFKNVLSRSARAPARAVRNAS